MRRLPSEHVSSRKWMGPTIVGTLTIGATLVAAALTPSASPWFVLVFTVHLLAFPFVGGLYWRTDGHGWVPVLSWTIPLSLWLLVARLVVQPQVVGFLAFLCGVAFAAAMAGWNRLADAWYQFILRQGPLGGKRRAVLAREFVDSLDAAVAAIIRDAIHDTDRAIRRYNLGGDPGALADTSARAVASLDQQSVTDEQWREVIDLARAWITTIGGFGRDPQYHTTDRVREADRIGEQYEEAVRSVAQARSREIDGKSE